MAAKILIVDDEIIARKLSKQILVSNGYSCTLAANAEEARKCLEKQKFELVLCDMKMPGESGLDFIKETLPRYEDTAVVMVTAVDDFQTVKTALDMGVYDYVLKPLNRNRLLICVTNALHRRKLEISNRTHRENLERMVSEASASLTMLHKVKEAVHSSLDLEKVYGEITDGVVHSMGYTTALIFELSEDKKYFKVKAFATIKQLMRQINKILGSPVNNLSLPADPNLNPNIRSVMEGRLVVIKSLEEIAFPVISKIRCSALQQIGRTKNYIIAPLVGEKEVAGALFISSSQNEVSEAELKIIESFSRAASSAVINANLNMQSKQVGRELRESEERYRNLIEGTYDMIQSIDMNGNFNFVNQSWLKKMEYSENELSDLNMFDIIHPDYLSHCMDMFKKVLAGESVKNQEVIFVTKNGNEIFVEGNASPRFVGNKVVGTQGFFRDVTERKQAEMELRMAYSQLQDAQFQLIQAEKMEVVGRLASGVAHEVKNPLAIILQGVDFLTKKIDTKDKNIHSTLSFIKDATYRADKVIKGLLDFSSVSKLDVRSENLNSIIESTILLIKHYLSKNKIQLIKDFNEKIPKVKIDKNRIDQVFINISMNAAQAMPDGGTLIFRTYTKSISQKDKDVGRRKEDLYKEGETVVIAEIEDTGPGIPEEDLDKIFDPFFTTKRGKGGTGLGLSSVRNIMDLHQGHIDIQNKESGGAKATLMFKIEE